MLCAVFLLGLTPSAKADDPGYFLSWQQKKDLLNLGRIQDAAGTWYDVWICPGYTPPASYSWKHLKMAGADFHEYIEANKYHSLKEGSKACFNWALQECGLGFTVKGIPRAWGENFSVARTRTERRVFGWWMAYPWAFLESTVETAFRGALGTVGTAGGIVSGVAIVPAYHALDSAVAGVWNLGVNTIVIPVVGVTWNTVIGPPLALVGQKPAESRVDGFWVTIVAPDRAPVTRQLSPEEARLLGQWGLLLLKETQPLAQQQQALDKHATEQEAQLRRALLSLRNETEQKRAELRREKAALVQQLATTNEQAAALLGQRALLATGGNGEAEVRRYLEGLHVASGDIAGILALLRTHAAPRTVAPSPVRPKTDPLQRSVDVIGKSAADALK
jgi:hypothetical protein